MTSLPLAARVYIGVVVLGALAGITPLSWAQGVDWSAFLVLAVLYVLFEWISESRFTRGVFVSVGFPIALAAVILLPPSGAAAIAMLRVVVHQRQPSPWFKKLFNGSLFAVSAVCGGLVYTALGGRHELTVDSFPYALVPVVGAALVYCLVNALLLVGILVAAERLSFFSVLRHTLSSSVATYLGYGLIGLMMAILWQSRFEAFAAVLVLLPLFVARWAFAQYAEQQAAYDATVRSLVQAVETKDYYTRGHSERVSKAAVMIARQIGMREDRITSLRYAGILHDVGKLGVPTRVLQKSGPLTEAEYQAVQLHPVRGLELVREIDFLGEAYDGIMYHHERLDGRGYPMGLAGDQIPEFARVIAVADAFDSMTSTRSYRRARSVRDALAELRACAGDQFDPAVVEALLQAVDADGWEPVHRPAPTEKGAEVARYDHDDPTTVLPVAPSSRS
jgi:hypothetical protein